MAVVMMVMVTMPSPVLLRLSVRADDHFGGVAVAHLVIRLGQVSPEARAAVGRAGRRRQRRSTIQRLFPK